MFSYLVCRVVKCQMWAVAKLIEDRAETAVSILINQLVALSTLGFVWTDRLLREKKKKKESRIKIKKKLVFLSHSLVCVWFKKKIIFFKTLFSLSIISLFFFCEKIN